MLSEIIQGDISSQADLQQVRKAWDSTLYGSPCWLVESITFFLPLAHTAIHEQKYVVESIYLSTCDNS